MTFFNGFLRTKSCDNRDLYDIKSAFYL